MLSAIKDNLQIQLLAKKIKEKFNPQKIILFGSYAYGTPEKGSDLDLFIIMDTEIPVREQAYLIRRELRGLTPIDIIVRTPEQVEERIKLGDFFIKKIMQDGVVLCFHSQQCIEKYMKAILQENEVEFEKIHDLDVLLQQSKDFIPELESYR